MKKLTLLLSLATVTIGASAAEVAGVIDGGAYDAAVGQAQTSSTQIDAQRVATSFLAGRFVAPTNVNVRGDEATVMAQVADMVCSVELTRETAENRDAWRVSASNRIKGNA